jgi:archaellum component FlaF (FlaF/FlaG flagellin family)
VGLGIAAATALLATTFVASGYAVSGAWFDAEEQLREARLVADTLQTDAAQSALSITALAHNSGSGHVTLTLRNTGAVSLEANDLDILLNGRVYTGADITITGHTGTLWHPSETLTLFFHGTSDLGSAFRPTAPTRATAISATGAMAFWSS